MSEKNELNVTPEAGNAENVAGPAHRVSFCPACGASVESYMSACPNCLTPIPDIAVTNEDIEKKDTKPENKKTGKKKIIIPIVSVLAVAVIALGVVFGMKVYKEQKEEKIANYLSEADTFYSECDFDKVEECYDSLESLGYDVSSQREILEYDREVFDSAYNFNCVLTDCVEKMSDSPSLSETTTLILAFDNALEQLEKQKINENSKLGKYIQDIEDNFTYREAFDTLVNIVNEYGDSIYFSYYATQMYHVDKMFEMFLSDGLSEVDFPYPEAITSRQK